MGAPAHALVVQGDPDEVTRSPGPGTGFDHVGSIGGTTGVYVGAGWVLTARHVGAADFQLGGAQYPASPKSWIALSRPGDAGTPDLGLFRVDPHPSLPPLEIAQRPPTPGDPLLLVGCGLGRGEAFEWAGVRGWRWAPPAMCRWGRNLIASIALDSGVGGASTRIFETLFSYGEPYEAQAAIGDSGGAGFAARRGRWVLAGIMISVKSLPRQPAATSVIGNATHLADLSHYRAEILAIIGQDPRDAAAGR